MILFFDIDDTLVDSKSAHRIALNKTRSEYSLAINPEDIFARWIDITSRYLKLYFQNKITLTAQRTGRIKELWEMAGLQITDDEAFQVYENYHRFFLQSCKAFPETIPVLEKLKDFRLGIITNGTVADQTRKLVCNGLIHYFDPVIISEGVGFSKPRKEIFQIAAERSGHHLSECIFIGDSYELDYQGGLNAGMRTVWLNRNEERKNSEEVSVSSLSEFVRFRF